MSVPGRLTLSLARGVTLEPRGDKLDVRPMSRVTAEERESLRQHKAEILALLAVPPLGARFSLDPLTVRGALGTCPDSAAVAAFEAEVLDAIGTYQTEVATGRIAARVLLVRGRPLADYLDLDTVARLIGSSRARQHLLSSRRSFERSGG